MGLDSLAARIAHRVANGSPLLRRSFAAVLRLEKRKYRKYKNQNIHYTRVNTPKRVTSDGAHLRDFTPGLHSSEETSQRWRADLTSPGIESPTSHTDSVCA